MLETHSGIRGPSRGLGTLLIAMVLSFPIAANGQCPPSGIIDFECDPTTGLPFLDQELVNVQYDRAPYFVRFSLAPIDSLTGPKIAQVGVPKTAFTGPNRSECGVGPTTADMPAAGQSVGCFFLTDDASSSSVHDLRIDYTVPTFQASGRVIDVEAGSFTEQWTITSRDEFDGIIETLIITEGDPGTGDGVATTWSFDSTTPIHAVLFDYTGGGGPGLAFDFYSPRSLGCMEIAAPTDTLVCDPTTALVDLSFDVTNDSGVNVHTIILTPPPGVEITPNIFSVPSATLPDPLVDGETVTLDVSIAGAEFGGPLCFTTTFMDSLVTECCSGGVCVSVAPCPCLVLSNEALTCTSETTGALEWTFDLTNMTASPADHLYFLQGDFVPNHIALGGLAPGATTSLATTLRGLPPGTSSIYALSLHDEFLGECCSVVRSIDSPCTPLASVVDDQGAPGLRAFARPNPFNPTTTITLALPVRADVVVAIYDGGGKQVRTLMDRPMEAATHRIPWDGRDDEGRRLAAGVFFYRVETSDAVVAGKLVLGK